jgi:NADH-quinone oxidoreductase subunit J
MLQGEYSLFYIFHFYLFGLLSIVTALLFVTRKSPVAAVMWLVVTMFNLAALYVLLDAQFIGAIQVIVYAGAIMVVFLFVIMLLNLGHASEVADMRGHAGRLVAGMVGVALLGLLAAIARARVPGELLLPAGTLGRQVNQTGVIAPVAGALFTEYLLAFEVTSVLLLAAVVGAVVLGKQRDRRPRRGGVDAR